VHFQVLVRWCIVVAQFLVVGLFRVLFNIRLEKYVGGVAGGGLLAKVLLKVAANDGCVPPASKTITASKSFKDLRIMQ